MRASPRIHVSVHVRVCACVMNCRDCGVKRQCGVGTYCFDCSFAPISLPPPALPLRSLSLSVFLPFSSLIRPTAAPSGPQSPSCHSAARLIENNQASDGTITLTL